MEKKCCSRERFTRKRKRKKSHNNNEKEVDAEIKTGNAIIGNSRALNVCFAFGMSIHMLGHASASCDYLTSPLNHAEQ